MKHLLKSLILMLSSTAVYAGGLQGDFVTVPEPGIYALLAIGAVGMFIARKRKK